MSFFAKLEYLSLVFCSVICVKCLCRPCQGLSTDWVVVLLVTMLASLATLFARRFNQLQHFSQGDLINYITDSNGKNY